MFLRHLVRWPSVDIQVEFMLESIVFCSSLRVRCRRKEVHVRYLVLMSSL